ncbi:MAG: 16S rRNA (uracil(1498)-N(3))-methyltransferase [Clostridia bacterium]|nr:16S rRNA (uracil(1498)-N(3))-methyltransferase [Clostridia bacterium]
MPRFFVAENNIDLVSGVIVIYGDDAHHISRSLRMAVGDHLTVCDGKSFEYSCVLTCFGQNSVSCTIVETKELTTEPPFSVVIYQALPKGDKLDTIIQKSIECGAASLVTFESEFCVAKEKEDSAVRKLERRRRIAAEAAKQCGRGIIPAVYPTMDFESAVKEAAKADIPLFCYEGEGTVTLKSLINQQKKTLDQNKITAPKISVIIGSEGGFSDREAEFAKENGMLMAGLGSRILRSETVAGFVLACLVYEFEL